MTDKARLTAAQYDALSRAVKKPLCKVADGRWIPVGSRQHIQSATVDRLLALGFLERRHSRAGTPLAEITAAGHVRLGLPPTTTPISTDAAARAAAHHERIAP